MLQNNLSCPKGALHAPKPPFISPNRAIIYARYMTQDAIGPLLGHAFHNEIENATLAATRGTLLPKLISGEIRVKDAAKIVEEAEG